ALALEPGPQPLVARAAEVEVPVPALAQHRDAAIDRAARRAEALAVEELPAARALVAARLLVAAEVAAALDVAVGQEAAERLAEELLLGPLDQVAVREQVREELLRELAVVRVAVMGGATEHVELDADALERAADRLVPAVDVLLVGRALLLGLQGDRDAVLVGAADEVHVVAAHPPEAHPDVGRQVGADDVAEVDRPVRVRERGSDDD